MTNGLCLQCMSRGCEHFKKRPKVPRLMPREIKMLQLLSLGLRNKEIAARMGITEGSVKFALCGPSSDGGGVYRKLALHSRLEAALWARDHMELLND